MSLRKKLALVTTIIVLFFIVASMILTIGLTIHSTTSSIVLTGISDFFLFLAEYEKQCGNSTLDQRANVSMLHYKLHQMQGAFEYSLQQEDVFICNNTGVNGVKVLDQSRNKKENTADFSLPIRYGFESVEGQHYFIVASDIMIGQETYTLSLVRDITETARQISLLTLKCILAGAFSTMLAAIFTFVLTRHLLDPIIQLEHEAKQIASGNYGKRIVCRSRDEVAALANQFNCMAEAISQKVTELNDSAERQRLFINSLSHEIKTPITSIMARAETLLSRDISESDRLRSLRRIREQCVWLERLSGKLETLTMLEGSFKMKQASVPALFKFVKTVVSDSLLEKNISLVSECNISTLPMDADLMSIALCNLIENAKRASEKNSCIALTAHDNFLEVSDNGQGIPPKDIDRVTEPFYMVDRSRSKKSGGVGLGLALVAQIAQVHGITLKINSTVGKGTSVRLIWNNVDN